MSDEMPTTRDGIADAITADLTAMDKVEETPPPAPEVAAASETPASQVPPAATAAAIPDAPLALSDKSRIIDPADGVEKTWGEIKAERLRWKDYTQKTQSIAETRKQVEQAEALRQAQWNALQAQQAAAGQADLPEDDPYAIRIKAAEAQMKYLAEADAQRQRAFDEQMNQAQTKENQAALEAAEKKIATDFGFEQREIDLVEAEFLRRGHAGEEVTLEGVAKDYKAYLDAREEKAVAKFKEKHRVSAPAGGASIPAAGVTDSIPVPGSRGFLDAIREEVGALMR